MRSISVQDLKPLVDAADVQVVDVREPYEYVEGHVPGAASMPLSTLPVRFAELDRHRPVHLVCAVGGRSAQAAAYLDQQGFDTVNIDGGTSDWVAAGFPVDR